MNVFLFFITFFVATVMGFPHVGMLDTPTVRDVGLIFDDRYYAGNSTFIIETRTKSTCVPINVDSNSRPQGLPIKSVQVCKPTTCIFFTGENCSSKSTGSFSVSCTGPGDVPNRDSNELFKSYICGANMSNALGVDDSQALVTVPHDPNASMV